MNFRTILFVSVTPLLLTACGNAKEDEAKRLGFSSASEMEDIHQKGWHTNAQYRADETARAKRLGFVDMNELHDAESAGIMDPVAFRKHRAEEEAREAAEERKQSEDRSNEEQSGSEDTPSAPPAQALTFKSEFAYQAKLGNPGVKGHSTSPDLFRKQLGTSAGAGIILPKMFVWSVDSSQWERGGKLYIINDDSLGSEFGVTCALSSDQGDKIMKNKQRREMDIRGTIASYSSSSGLMIDPCEITRDELGVIK